MHYLCQDFRRQTNDSVLYNKSVVLYIWVYLPKPPQKSKKLYFTYRHTIPPQLSCTIVIRSNHYNLKAIETPFYKTRFEIIPSMIVKKLAKWELWYQFESTSNSWDIDFGRGSSFLQVLLSFANITHHEF